MSGVAKEISGKKKPCLNFGFKLLASSRLVTAPHFNTKNYERSVTLANCIASSPFADLNRSTIGSTSTT